MESPTMKLIAVMISMVIPSPVWELVKIGGLLDEFVLGQGLVTERFYLLLDMIYRLAVLRFHQYIGHRKPRGRDILNCALIRRIKRRDSEPPARCDSRDADDLAAVVVQLEFRPERRILDLREFRVFHHDESVFGVNVLDSPRDEFRSAEKAGVVEPDHRYRLIHAAAKLDQRAA